MGKVHLSSRTLKDLERGAPLDREDRRLVEDDLAAGTRISSRRVPVRLLHEPPPFNSPNSIALILPPFFTRASSHRSTSEPCLLPCPDDGRLQECRRPPWPHCGSTAALESQRSFLSSRIGRGNPCFPEAPLFFDGCSMPFVCLVQPLDRRFLFLTPRRCVFNLGFSVCIPRVFV